MSNLYTRTPKESCGMPIQYFFFVFDLTVLFGFIVWQKTAFLAHFQHEAWVIKRKKKRKRKEKKEEGS